MRATALTLRLCPGQIVQIDISAGWDFRLTGWEMGGRLRVDDAAVIGQRETVSWILTGGFMAGNSMENGPDTFNSRR
ncbi:MAG TPA: hypothetical protein VJ044_11695 [Candidatus Hodarchaeales archaeon]|nr:hypothetical protein [Candidatus Hodarchaeales archaeon]